MTSEFVYAQPVKIFFGRGQFARLGAVLTELGIERAVLVCGRHFAPEAEKLMAADGRIRAVFDRVEQNPQLSGIEETVRLCREILPREGWSILQDVQVLSPMHRQECGTDNLNKLLQEALNPKSPHKPEFKNSVQTFRLGDKVMQTKNNYQKHVFNGDIGFIVQMEPEKASVKFADDFIVDYTRSELIELQLAYAMSVHKSQGSEYPIIILPLVESHYIMLQRNLLYTAVTRAKQRVILLGSRAALNTAVENDRTKRRYTLLAERLAQQIDS